jgi:hypothetical protein
MEVPTGSADRPRRTVPCLRAFSGCGCERGQPGFYPRPQFKFRLLRRDEWEIAEM